MRLEIRHGASCPRPPNGGPDHEFRLYPLLVPATSTSLLVETAPLRYFEPIPFGICERLDGFLLTGSALGIRDRHERRGDDERGGKSNHGLHEHQRIS